MPPARLRLHADRRRRHGVHVQPEDRRQAGHQPAAVGRERRQDLHRRDHEVERPGDPGRQPGAGAARRGSCRWCAPTARARRRSSRCGCRSSTATCGRALHAGRQFPRRPPNGQGARPARSASPATSARATARAPSPTSSTPTPWSRASRSRRCSTRPATTSSRPPTRRRGAAPGADQQRPGLSRLPHPDPRRRLHQHRPAHLPAVVLLVHDRADRGRRRVHRGEGQRRSAPSQLLAVRGPAAGRRTSATRRCRSTSCRPASSRSSGSPASGRRASTSTSATTRRSSPATPRATTCSRRPRRSPPTATSAARTSARRERRREAGHPGVGVGRRRLGDGDGRCHRRPRLPPQPQRLGQAAQGPPCTTSSAT